MWEWSPLRDWLSGVITPYWTFPLLTLVQAAMVTVGLILTMAFYTLAERKVIGWIQARRGPNRVNLLGIPGLAQPFADVLKLLTKEILIPADANGFLFRLAPFLALIPSLAMWAVIPLSPEHAFANIDAGLLYILALTSMGVYGIILAGYASNSKYPLLASLRASAQLISYEVAVTLTLVSVILMSGSLSMVSIVRAQESGQVWYAFAQPLAFVIFFIGGLAETNRAPFDMPEAEQELTGGFHTEYSGMRFALFFLAEYANMIVVSSVATTLFLGGWLRPFPNVAVLSFLDIVPSWTWFLIKSFLFLYFFIWIRATLPRYRYDQLMRLGWKVLIPLAIANLVLTGILKVMFL